MRPFIGEKWEKINKILLIGESHSLEGFADEKTITGWYIKKDEDLTKDQEYNTATGELIRDGLKSGNFHKNRIYSNINDVIKSVNNEIDLKYFSFMNFYQRPAIKEYDVFNKKDNSVANKTVNEVVKILKPDYIFFLSSVAWERFNIEYDNEILMNIFDNKKIGHSCHPANSWWNRESGENEIVIGNKEKNTGKMTFKKFIEIAIQ
jgi:hypothetical protein